MLTHSENKSITVHVSKMSCELTGRVEGRQERVTEKETEKERKRDARKSLPVTFNKKKTFLISDCQLACFPLCTVVLSLV